LIARVPRECEAIRVSKSFLRFFFSKADVHPADHQVDSESIDMHRRRINSIRAEQMKSQSKLDLAKRVANLESQLAEAGLVIESLIELIEERLGLSRAEIKERLITLAAEPHRSPLAAEEQETRPEAHQPIDPKPIRITTTEDKEPFQTRRKWRDARSRR